MKLFLKSFFGQEIFFFQAWSMKLQFVRLKKKKETRYDTLENIFILGNFYWNRLYFELDRRSTCSFLHSGNIIGLQWFCNYKTTPKKRGKKNFPSSSRSTYAPMNDLMQKDCKNSLIIFYNKASFLKPELYFLSLPPTNSPPPPN